MTQALAAPTELFLLRVPTLPFSDLRTWSEHSGLTNEPAASVTGASAHLIARLSIDPLFATAIQISSPTLWTAVRRFDDLDSDRRRRVERSLTRYFARMTGRATPRDLFAAPITGRVATSTRINVGSGDDVRCFLTLSADTMDEIAKLLERDHSTRDTLTFERNTTLYEAGAAYRYLVKREGTFQYELESLEPSRELRAVLEQARHGARVPQMIAAVRNEGHPEEAAAAFVAELIESGVVESNLRRRVTGETGVAFALDQGGDEMSTSLRTAIAALSDATDRSMPVEPMRVLSQVEEIGQRLVDIGVRATADSVVTDAVRPAAVAELSPLVAHKAAEAITVLARVAPRRQQPQLSAFAEKFANRWGDGFVPLATALDEDLGIGWNRLSGRVVTPPTWGRQAHRFLLSHLVDCAERGAQVVQLEGYEEILADRDPAPVPSAMSLKFSVLSDSQSAIDKGRFSLVIDGAFGPAPRLLARHAQFDPKLRDALRRHLAYEASAAGSTVLAEVAFMPDRAGTIALRPILREYELNYLGRSGAPNEHRLAIDDLFVGVQGDRVVVWSRSLDRQIEPRVSSPHNWRWYGAPTYRFLAALEQQGVSPGLSWSWRDFEGAAFLPRVEVGRLTLSPAQWIIEAADLMAITRGSLATRFDNLQRWRQLARAPRWMHAVDAAGNRTPVDLESPLMVDSLVSVDKAGDSLMLAEFPQAEQSWLATTEGTFVHEIIMPTNWTPATTAMARRPVLRPTYGVERHAPGGIWTYAKIYANPSVLERALCSAIPTLIAEAHSRELFDCWFYVRYHDPECHLRLRFQQPSDGHKFGELQLLLANTADALFATDEAWRLQFDTYQPELGRYGGDQAMPYVHQIFSADSDASLKIVASLQAAADNVRLLVLAAGIDRLFADFKIPIETRLRIIERGHRRQRPQPQMDAEARRYFAGFHTGLLDAIRGAGVPVSTAQEALERRSIVLAPLVERLRTVINTESTGAMTWRGVAASVAHMHANRILEQEARISEDLARETLRRAYSEVLARNSVR